MDFTQLGDLRDLSLWFRHTARDRDRDRDWETMSFYMYCTHYTETRMGTGNHCYRPATVIAERLFYTPVCHSVHRGWCVLHPPRQTPPGKTPPRQNHHPPRPETATASDGTHPTGAHSCFLLCPSCSLCRNAKSLYCVGLHWRVPFIEDLSETVQVVW